PTAQPLREDVPVGGIVIDNPHGQVVKRDLPWSRTGSGGVWLSAEVRRECKRAALARRTVHRDGSAHEGHQPGSDGQAQAGPAVLARGGGVFLLEGPVD